MQEVAELPGGVKLVLWGVSLGIAALAIYAIPPLQAAFQWIDA